MLSKIQAANWRLIECLIVFETFYTETIDQKLPNISLGLVYSKKLVTQVSSEHSFQTHIEHLPLPVKAAG